MNNRTQENKLIDIEKVFIDKNPGLFKLIPKPIIKYLKNIIHQDELNEFIDSSKDQKGIAFVERVFSHLFPIEIKHKGLEKIPADGRYMFISNHPLGGLDGLAFILAASEKFENIKFPVNDILMNLEGLKEIFIPINKHGGYSKESARIFEKAIVSDCQILYFPAGLVSRKIKGEIIDVAWKSSFLKKAISSKRDIVPVHISGRNRDFFYNLAKFRSFLGIKANIEMLYLPNEMFKFQSKEIVINFGTPIPYKSINSDLTISEWVLKIREQSYALANE